MQTVNYFLGIARYHNAPKIVVLIKGATMPFQSAPASTPPPPPVFCGPVPLAFSQAMLEFLIQLVISVPPHADCISPITGALRLASISISVSS